MRKVNLGCGSRVLEGYINIDRYDYGQGIVRDVEKGFPFDNDSVDEIIADHVLEHIDDLVFVMNEIYRVLKNGGVLKGKLPLYPIDVSDPTHKHYFNRNSVGWWEWAYTGRKEVQCRFKLLEYKEEGEIRFTFQTIKPLKGE